MTVDESARRRKHSIRGLYSRTRRKLVDKLVQSATTASNESSVNDLLADEFSNIALQPKKCHRIRKFDPSIDFLAESLQNPVCVRKDEPGAYCWQIHNLPHPKHVFSVELDKASAQIVISTSTKKYYKRLSIPTLNHNDPSIESTMLTWMHENDRLIIRFARMERTASPGSHMRGKKDPNARLVEELDPDVVDGMYPLTDNIWYCPDIRHTVRKVSRLLPNLERYEQGICKLQLTAVVGFPIW